MDNCEIYYSPCPTCGQFVIFDPKAPPFQNAPMPTALPLEKCPVCGGGVRLVGFQVGIVSHEERDRGWTLEKPRPVSAA